MTVTTFPATIWIHHPQSSQIRSRPTQRRQNLPTNASQTTATTSSCQRRRPSPHGTISIRSKNAAPPRPKLRLERARHRCGRGKLPSVDAEGYDYWPDFIDVLKAPLKDGRYAFPKDYHLTFRQLPPIPAM